MRRVGLALAVGVLMAGTSAYAQTGGPTVGSQASNQWVGQDTFTFTPPANTTAGTATFSEGQFHAPNTNSIAYSSFVDVTPGLVTFESGNSSSGPWVTTTSSSIVNINFTNTTGHAVSPTIASTISAAGLGFYMADKSSGCDFGTCPGTLAHGFGALSGAISATSYSTPVAGASFTFRVTGDDNVLYNLTGSADLFVNADGAFNVVQTLDSIGPGSFVNDGGDPLDASHRLAGFTHSWDTTSAFGYAWDATDINPTFTDIVGVGASANLTYETSVSSFTRSYCLADNTCVVAYSGFGDPIGRGGDVISAKSPFGLFSLGSSGAPIVQGINFTPSSFRPPTFGPDGVLTFKAGVPEPATWMSMILGFGFLGAALRRRRVLAYN